MTTATRQRTTPRWALSFLAAIFAVLAVIGLAATASAATQAGAETRVGASDVPVTVAVGPPQHIAAGQRLGEAAPGVVTVVATGVAAETVPLDWSLVSKAGETRAAHVALHEAENVSKMAHGVFLGDSQALTNEAWSIAQSRGIAPISEGGVDIYRVPMGRNVGYAGGANAWEMAEVPHRTIEIITRGGTNELITAYPVPLG
ncbi:hypothetical protein GCM10028801_01950 [Nocardioides maradonensis]